MTHPGREGMEAANRRLAGILAADVVGYSSLVGADEPGTLARVRALRREVIEPLAKSHGGRLFKTTGDGFLAEFASAVQALRCAVAIQHALGEQSEGLRLRIGVHQGEVVAEGDDLLGDGVIIAARLEPLAEPGGICISGRVREDAAGKIPLEVDDIGTPTLKNIATRVQVFRVRSGETAHASLPLPDRPSLVVLPFQNMSGDPEQEYFADGMVEEITTALSRVRSLFVIARNSAFIYKGRAVDVRQVGRDLGVRYVLEGSVRKAGSRVRITGQLIEAESGSHIWADRFEGDLADIFQLQDQVTACVAGAIEPNIRLAEIERSLRKPADSLAAYDLVLRARSLVDAGNRDGPEHAVALLIRALEIDPHYALALARLAWTRFVSIAQHQSVPSEPELVECVDLAKTAVRLGATDPEVLCTAGYIIAVTGGELEEGLSIIDQSLVQNPNSADALAISGAVRAFLGDTETAFRHLQQANRLSPLHQRISLRHFGLMLACFVDGDYVGVLEWSARSLRDRPSSMPALRYRAAALALLGRIDEARQVVEQLLSFQPDMSIARCRRHIEVEMKNPYRRPGVVEAYYKGLRLAGLPE
jgi:TolB-like protein